MCQKYLLFTILIITGISKPSFSQINWMTWEDVQQASQTEKRKVIVDVYTSWCAWCKRMDQQTFNHEKIIDYVNENYYCIKFNAEHRENIQFNGQVFRFNKTRKHHTLASKILRGRMSYPSTVFLDENLQVIQPVPGFHPAEEFLMMLSFFATDSFKNTPWSDYKENYVEK